MLYRNKLLKTNLLFSHHIPKYSKIQRLIADKKNALLKMKKQYPHLLSKNFHHDRIVYTLQEISPKEMVEAGGLIDNSYLWLSNTGSGDNQGCIAFSLLPEITTLFTYLYSGQKKIYLYAFLLNGEFLLPGGPWRQVISPGVFPLTSKWMSRELLHINEMTRQIILGPLMGNKSLLRFGDRGERFEDFYENRIVKPEGFDVGDDIPYVYSIKDTEYSGQFQQKVQEHYTKMNRFFG